MTGGRNLNKLSYSTTAAATHSGKDLASMTRDAKAAEDSEFDLEVEKTRIAPLRARITRNKNKRAMDDIVLDKSPESEHSPHPAIPYPHISPAYQYPTQQRPSKRRRIPKRLPHIPPEVRNIINYHKAFHSCPSQLIHNGVRFDHPCGSRYEVNASTKCTARGMTGKQPTTPAYQYPRQQRPSKRRKISKQLSHIPPEVRNVTNYHKVFHSCPSQLIQNGVRFDHSCGSRYGVNASTKRTARGMTGKQPTTRKPGKHDYLPTSDGASPTTSTSHQLQEGSHTGSIYPAIQLTSPPIVSRGFEDSYQPAMYIPSDDFWPSSSFVPSPASPQILVPTTHVVQTPDLGLQAHFLEDGLESQAVLEQSANEVLSPLTDWFELWKSLPWVSPVTDA